MTPVHRASLGDTARIAAAVLLPVVARGVIVRRPRVLALLERFDADRRAVRLLGRLAGRYGADPLLLRLPGRSVAVALDPADAQRVLAESPEPFAPATREKRASLAHFQPGGVLISRGRARDERRRFTEAVLETGHPTHHLAGQVREIVDEETRTLDTGTLGWDEFATMWWRIVRRLVLGDAARDDSEVTDLLRSLRKDANWAYLKPRRSGVRHRFQARLRHYLAAAEPGSLAEVIAHMPASGDVRPDQQVPHWLFAFDAAGMVSLRTLALLAAHPHEAERAGADAARLRACVLESVRLWPTTPAILRETTRPTDWHGHTLPAGTTVLVLTPFLHRDERTLPYADTFAPDIWLDGRAHDGAVALVPFSAGPGQCPGQDLVLLTTGILLAALLDRFDVRADGAGRLDPARPLPGTLDPFTLSFRLTARAPTSR
ncbi:MAG TPA: cytochrome P450 [Pseudonocardiaceae bacterium]|jgi:cytochrome P450|nr:cytochrome P450 [Pseudonocardiaceae bacterium]